ncbi:MAG: hypothetical protein ABI222_16735 [Opitutaceae bacterium]
MRPRVPFSALLVLATSLVLAGLTGCSTVHGWGQASSGHSPSAGASVNLPLGK